MSPARPLRLFVALYPPRETAERLLARLADVAEGTPPIPPYRAVAPEAVHLTLLFIGEASANRLDEVSESVGRAASGLPVLRLTPTRLITLPDRGDPRLVAAEAAAPPELFELVKRLAQRLAGRPRKDPAGGFLPHLTLARFPHAGPTPARVDLPLDEPPFDADRVVLVRSVLLPGGAEHRPVRASPLG